MPTLELPTPTPLPGEANKIHVRTISKRKTRGRTIWQFVRFGLVGCVNTTIDLLVLNGLLWPEPEQGTARLLLFNTLAYACGALNSFVFNRYWTFQRTGRPKAREGARFLLVTLAAIVCNDLIVWLMRNILLPVHLNPTLWTNSSKVAAIGGTILVSYLGMRLWVFVQSSHEKRERFVHTGTWRHEELPDKTASDHGLLKGDTGAMIHTDKIGVTTFFPHTHQLKDSGPSSSSHAGGAGLNWDASCACSFGSLNACAVGYFGGQSKASDCLPELLGENRRYRGPPAPA